MKLTVEIESSKIDHFLAYLEKNNISWTEQDDQSLLEDLSDAQTKILSHRIELANQDPTRLTSIEEFYKSIEKPK